MRKREDVYSRLARHLNDLPAGFPPTSSGVEIRILRRLFSEDEAELALSLTLIPERPSSVAGRAHLPLDEAERRLDEMSRKGLIYRAEGRDGRRRFSANQFVIGIWEYQVGRLDPDLARDMGEYLPTLMDKGPWSKTPQLRTIPVMKAIPVRREILAHEKAEDLLAGRGRFLIAPCICRREQALVGHGCGKMEEACLIMGSGVDYYRDNGIGRVIDRDEALAILKRADAEGLVLQPSNAKRVANICMCCGCCCGVLRTIKAHPRPAEFVSSPFRAAFGASTCRDCLVCLTRCPMDALTRDEAGTISLRPERCIGCGLCVSTCPSGRLTLVRKPAGEQREVPATFARTYIDMARKRGKLARLAGAWLRSAVFKK
ncbi:MAG: 4Fe-4S dicluster domain-containing protein [Acidobacteriota bacterium]|nr:4Fe-4S dicluster domain-containing protein [Acidobacteriota bacterium]